MRGNEKYREASFFRADGVVNMTQTHFPRHYGKSTTPSTPPHGGGEYRLSQPIPSYAHRAPVQFRNRSAL